MACASGGRPPRDVKVYSIQPDVSYCDPVEPWCDGKVGLVRKQAKEVKSFEQSKDFVALSPEDFQRVVSTCPQPE